MIVLCAVPSTVETSTVTGPMALSVFNKRTSTEPASSDVVRVDDATLTLTTVREKDINDLISSCYH